MLEKTYITTDGYARLLNKHMIATTVKRKETTENIKIAIESTLSDLSENIEYIEALTAQRNLENKISMMEDQMQSSRVIDISTIENKGIVRFGLIAEYREEGKSKTTSLRIVGPNEAEIKDGTISYKAPLGEELLRLEVGDEFICQKRTYEVIDIRK